MIHPELYQYFIYPQEWKTRFLTPELRSKNWDLYVREEMPNVYTIPAFTDEFCDYIIEEAESCNCWTFNRHEFYPTTDMLLDVLGLTETYNEILKEYFWDIAIDKFKLEEPEWRKLNPENFLARYHPFAQYHLSLHHDDAQITTVVTLNENFTGGGTYFSKQKTKLQGKKGWISIHPGQITHRHGGLPVESGQRYIIVSFCRLPK
jgi:hypothetical protein